MKRTWIQIYIQIIVSFPNNISKLFESIWRWRGHGQEGGQGRPGWKRLKNDMKELGLASANLDRHAWKRKIVGTRADPGLSETPWDSSLHE